MPPKKKNTKRSWDKFPSLSAADKNNFLVEVQGLSLLLAAVLGAAARLRLQGCPCLSMERDCSALQMVTSLPAHACPQKWRSQRAPL